MIEDSSVGTMEKKVRSSSLAAPTTRAVSSSSINDVKKKEQPSARNHGGRGRRDPYDNRQRYPVSNQKHYQQPKPRAEASYYNQRWTDPEVNVDQRHNVKSANKKKKGDASHLLNFSYRQRETMSGPPARRRNWNKQKNRMSKEQFLQANCQFVIKPNCDPGPCMSDPDKLVDWDSIEQVRIYDQQLASCPICLEIPVAAQMTKCAHIYCWSCILHYLSLSDKAWAKCPICHDMVEENELKSVLCLTSPDYKVGETMAFRLMKRERGSTYVRPVEDWMSQCDEKVFTLSDCDVDVRYSKLIASSVQDSLCLIGEQKEQLQQLLSREDTESLEASFVQAALNLLLQKEARLSQIAPRVAVNSTVVAPDAQVLTTPHIVKPKLTIPSVMYLDAFDDEPATPIHPANKTSSLPASEPGASAEPNASVSEQAERPHTATEGYDNLTDSDEQRNESEAERSRSSVSLSSCDSGELAHDQMVNELVLPPTGTQSGCVTRGGANKRTDIYYFYQAADGQHVYLHSLNTRLIAAQYGSLEMAPTNLTANIVEIEGTTMTADARSRLKYLSHLPLHCQYSVVEVALRPPVVCSKTIAMFSDEIDGRKKARSRRQRAEKQQQRKAHAEERRRMGHRPDMNLSLRSEQHFPEAPIIHNSDTGVVSSAQPAADITAEQDNLPPQSESGMSVRTPYSFAQAMRQQNGNQQQSNWPKVKRSPVETEVKGHEEGSAPAFKDSFGAAIDKAFTSLQLEEKGSDAKRSSKKKKKPHTLLFSTSQRPNL